MSGSFGIRGLAAATEAGEWRRQRIEGRLHALVVALNLRLLWDFSSGIS